MYMMKIKDDLSRDRPTAITAWKMNAALRTDAGDPAHAAGQLRLQQIMQSGHPYGELVKWHRQARAQAAIGADPQAWLRQQQQEWLDDPKEQLHAGAAACQATAASS